MMEDQNIEKMRKVSIDIVKANYFAIMIMVVSALVLLVPFFIIWGIRKPFGEMFHGALSILVFFIGMVIGVVVHELIHGITWAIFAKRGWRSISFGVMWKLLTPYCHCDEPLSKVGYMAGGLMPCIILGIIPSVVALFTGHLVVLLWGIFFIAGAAGDIWMIWLLSKEKAGCMVLDHPSEAGFYIMDKEPTDL